MSKLVFKNTFLYSMGNMAQRGISFLLVFFYALYLTPSDIGVINTLQVFSAIYGIILSFGLERSVYRLYHDYKDGNEKEQFLGTISIGIIVVALIIISLTFLFRGLIENMIQGISFFPFLVLGITDAFINVNTIVPKLLFQVKEKPLHYIGLTLGTGILTVITVLAVLNLGYTTALDVIIASLVASLLLLPLNIIVIIKNMRLKFDFSIFKASLKYSLPLLPSLLSSWVINMSDRLFLKKFYSFEKVGYYSVAYKVGQSVQLFATAVLMAYTPYFYSLANKPKVDNHYINKLHNYNVYCLFAICIVTALLANDVIAIALPADYLSILNLIPFVILGYFFIQMIGLQNLAFHQTKKTLLLMVINSIAAAINLMLNYFLISTYGMSGAVAATVLTQMLFFALSYYISCKIFYLRINLPVIIGLLSGSALVLYICYTLITPGWLSLSVKLGILSMSSLWIYKKVKSGKIIVPTKNVNYE